MFTLRFRSVLSPLRPLLTRSNTVASESCDLFSSLHLSLLSSQEQSLPPAQCVWTEMCSQNPPHPLPATQTSPMSPQHPLLLTTLRTIQTPLMSPQLPLLLTTLPAIQTPPHFPLSPTPRLIQEVTQLGHLFSLLRYSRVFFRQPFLYLFIQSSLTNKSRPNQTQSFEPKIVLVN